MALNFLFSIFVFLLYVKFQRFVWLYQINEYIYICTMSTAINDILHVMCGILLSSCTWKSPASKQESGDHITFSNGKLVKHVTTLEIFKRSFAIIQCITYCSNANFAVWFIANLLKYRIQQLFLVNFWDMAFQPSKIVLPIPRSHFLFLLRARAL